ncbi:uncharacterized protein LOC135496556 [Lineus longissimus]|uniref:uncharacterized protein LOC135496556 n=1 Tax=Lineus longissimus TaxID=88925 RepID=UPI002B4E6B59
MADSGRAGAVTGIRQKYNSGRQTVGTRPGAAPTTSKGNQPKAGASISTNYKEFAGKDEYGYIKNRSSEAGQPAVDIPERPKTGHGRHRGHPQPAGQGVGHVTQSLGTKPVPQQRSQATGAVGVGTKQNVPARASQYVGQRAAPQPSPRTNLQSKANILTLTNNRSTSNSNAAVNVSQKTLSASQSAAPASQAVPSRRMSQDSVVSTASMSSGPQVPSNVQEQSWDMMEARMSTNQVVEADTEMDGRPRTSRGRRRRPEAPAVAEAQVEPPAPPAFTADIPERPKTSHGRRGRQEAQSMEFQESVGPHDHSSLAQDVSQPIGPSPPPYPPPAKRQNSANRHPSLASRKSSIDATPADIVQQLPDVRPTSAALQRYKRLPSIGDKTASDNLTGVTQPLRKMSLEQTPGQVPQVTAVKKELHRHYTPPQVLTIADMDQSNELIPVSIQAVVEPATSPLPGEPMEGERRVLLAIRLPSGERLQRYFHISDTLGVVLKFAEQIAEKKFTGYSFVCSVPRKVFNDMEQEIKDTGLQDRTVLLLQAPD